jgi:hypothetical protein
MQASRTRTAEEREEAVYRVIGTDVRVTVPESLREWIHPALKGLTRLPADPVDLEAPSVRISAKLDGWSVEADDFRVRAETEEEVLQRLQEAMLEVAAARRGDRVLFRGSVVTRGAQSLLIVGDLGSAHTLLALALTTLGFHLVSVGTAAFDTRRLLPVPLPLSFRMEPSDREALPTLTACMDEQLVRLSPTLLRPRAVTVGSELTHVIFPGTHAGRLSLLRPISATAARSRLCSALVAAPSDSSPFTAVAELLRHTRGVHLSIGELPSALEQLARLLPRWSVAREA